MNERSEQDREAERRLRAQARAGGAQMPVRQGPARRRPSRPSAGPSRRAARGQRIWVRRAVAAGMLCIGAFAVWFLVMLFEPFGGGGNGTGRIEVTIPARASTGQIASLLASEGIVDSSFFFELRAKLGGDHFRAGTFPMAHGMSYSAALTKLTSAPALPTATTVTIIPGKSRWQLDELLRSQGVPGSYLRETVRSRLLDPRDYGAPASTPSLEGFLYPDTYDLQRPLKISALVADQLVRFKQEFATVNFSYAKSKQLTEYDVLTIASLADAEAATPGDLAKVASVIYNRLRLGMELGLDTTAAYAADNYTGNLTAAQLDSSSPWNTLNHHGLPPTPINSPSIGAIDAAAHPAHTDYLYFIVKVCGNGALAFTANYEQFLRWSAAYDRSVQIRGADRTEFCTHR